MANSTMRSEQSTEEQLAPTIAQAFARVHKAAFGVAVGTAGALVMGALTVIVLLRPAASTFPLHLLNEYFAGYAVSWPGLLIGMAWGFAVAFVAGWFLAFCRNLSVAITAFSIRTRAEIEQTRTFLDHI
ncbi:MAG: hypothetical protein IPK85_12005 [Gemmatimonadetes bacterium]|nr:hypothetical protein [Gemmatimonadota bacterium]